jgi:Spy/CpxP family protein refolding chaperone
MKAWKAMAAALLLLGAAGGKAAWAQPGEFDGEGPHGPDHHGPGPGRGPDSDGPGMGGGMGLGGPDFLNPKVLKDLGLSEDQQKRIKDQGLAMRKKKIQLHSEKSILELDLQNVLSTAPVKEAEALKLAEKIAEVDKKALLLRVETMARFLAGLTPEQHRKMMEHQAEMREKRKAWREEMDRGWKREKGDRGERGPKNGKGSP